MEKNNRYKHVKWCLEGLKRKSKKYLNANVDANVFFFLLKYFTSRLREYDRKIRKPQRDQLVCNTIHTKQAYKLTWFLENFRKTGILSIYLYVRPKSFWVSLFPFERMCALTNHSMVETKVCMLNNGYAWFNLMRMV